MLNLEVLMADICLKKFMICEECGGTCAWIILRKYARKFAFSDRGRNEGKESVMIAIHPDGYRPHYLMTRSLSPALQLSAAGYVVG
jgi:hypothetical protein